MTCIVRVIEVDLERSLTDAGRLYLLCCVGDQVLLWAGVVGTSLESLCASVPSLSRYALTNVTAAVALTGLAVLWTAGIFAAAMTFPLHESITSVWPHATPSTCCAAPASDAGSLFPCSIRCVLKLIDTHIHTQGQTDTHTHRVTRQTRGR